MKTFILAISAREILSLLRAEMQSAHGQPELDTTCGKDYVIEEEFDRAAYGIRNGEDCDLVTSVATLTIEPRVESGFWVLELVVERAMGALPVSAEDALAPCELSLDAFDNELRALGPKRVIVRLNAQTSAVRESFERWLSEMRARHPLATRPPEKETHPMPQSRKKSSSPAGPMVKEVVGVFRNADSLESAVDALERSGFDRAAISILATEDAAKARLDRFYRTFKAIEDGGSRLKGAFVSAHSRAEGEAALVGIPLYIGGFAGAFAVAATGGALALAIASTILFGAVGAGIGAVLASAIADGHAVEIGDELKRGGLVLWVSAPSGEQQRRATAVLTEAGARDVHMHEYLRGAKETVPALQPDPLLDRDRGLEGA